MNNFEKRPVSKTRKNKKLLLNDLPVKNYWKNESPNFIAPVLQEMDSKENWTSIMSDVNIVPLLKEFIRLVTDENLNDKALYAKTDDILTILAYMKSSWMFRFLKWLDDYRTPVLNKLFISAVNNTNQFTGIVGEYITPSELYIDRMLAIKQLSLLNHIFNEERSNMIDVLLEKIEVQNYAQ